MNKYIVSYTRIPTNYNDPHSIVVEAESEDGAREIARHHLRDFASLANYVYRVRPYVAPPAGRVIA